MSGLLVAAVVCASLLTPTLAVNSEADDFQDGFEIGDVSSWSAFVGGPPITPPAPLRFTEVWVRDPHFVADFGFPVGCFDFTDTPVPIVGLSVNNALAASIGNDNDSDGYLDLSLMLLFRPFETTAVGEIVDARNGACIPPANATTCHVATTGTEVRGYYDGLPAGPCLTVDPGDTSGYPPGISEPTAPCFTTAPQYLYFTVFGDQPLQLRDTQISATTVGTAPDNLIEGLIVGFLREADANAILLPASYPIVGGEPISLLLPGGAGNCSVGDDKDMHGGYSGWWFFLNFTAENVPWTGL